MTGYKTMYLVHFLAVCIWGLCGMVAAVGTPIFPAQPKHVIKIVFGYDRPELADDFDLLQNHLPDNFHFKSRHALHYILCATMAQKNVAVLQLIQKASPFQVVYASINADMVCYIAILSSTDAAELSFGSIVDSETPFFSVSLVPDFLRIDHTLYDIAATHIKGRSSYLEVHHGLGVRSTFKMEQTTDGFFHELSSKIMGMDHRSIISSKSLRHLMSILDASITRSPLSKRLQLWHSTVHFLQDTRGHNTNIPTLCGFQHLRMRSSRQGFRVYGIDFLAERECIIILALYLIESSHDIISITASLPMNFLNNFARPISQVGLGALTNENNGNVVSTDSSPYSAAGLDGLNQIVSVGDSGLDELMCFFTNGDGTVVKRSNISNPYTDLSRRKVIQYITYADGGDWAFGHGTHVTGSAVGAAIDPASANATFNGMATGAKLAFFDIGPDDGTYSGLIPGDMYKDYYEVLATSGALINSNSWGTPLNYYNSEALQTDEYLYDHPNFMVLFAAGNYGQSGYGTVHAPAVSKNSVTVGCAQTGHGDKSSAEADTLSSFTSIGPTFDGRIKPDICA